MDNKKVIETIADGILNSIPQENCDKTYIGRIIGIINTKKYKIRYDDADRELNTKNVLPMSVGDIVHIVYPCGDSKKSYMLEDVMQTMVNKN